MVPKDAGNGRGARKDDPSPLVGAHLSITGGIPRSVDKASELGCVAFQIFTKNSNQWQGREIPAEEVQEFRSKVDEGGFSHVIAHDSYLINVASPDETLRKRSEEALADEVERSNLLGLDYLVMHPGAHRGDGVEVGLERVAGSLQWILERFPEGGVKILLETTAGQGSSLGSRFEELRWLVDRLEAGDRIGVCLDTCHVFTAGYDIRDQESYKKTMNEFDDVVGLDRLKLIHLNDTLKEFNSRVDRHHHIGEGNIGLDGFRQLMTDKRLRDLPMIIETPKGDDDKMDRKNLAILRKLAAA
jgi:deoxyribonuclease-4